MKGSLIRNLGRTLFVLALFLSGHGPLIAAPISYQGQLQQAGSPFTGSANLSFALFDEVQGGNQVGSILFRENWPVQSGLFHVDLDFGPDSFGSQPRYLEVRVNGQALSPRQPVQAVPVAQFALDGNAGPEGPPGAEGPQGVPGPEGPPGASPFVYDPDTGSLVFSHEGLWLRYLADVDEDESPSIILGHAANDALFEGTVIAGGGTATEPNLSLASHSVIGGGRGNLAGDESVAHVGITIAGGFNNHARFSNASIGGGANNVAWTSGTVAGGIENYAGNYAAVGGGSDNTASGPGSVVGGGLGNWASSSASVIGGGSGNVASGQQSVVGGGLDNISSSFQTTVGGGNANLASTYFATVAGGQENSATGRYSAVAGGSGNTASAFYSVVSGGYENCAGGRYSWASGRSAKVRPGWGSGDPGTGCGDVPMTDGAFGDMGTFVWADSQSSNLVSFGSNQFLVRAQGGIWLGTNSAPSIPTGVFLNTSTGGHLTSGGAWTNASDRALKDALEPVDGDELLTALDGLPLYTWHYLNERPDTRRLGPMAQDFHAAFGLGNDDRSISTVDANGVALATVQALNRRLERETPRCRHEWTSLSSK
jgi:trimeric autotransporter adhesin